MLCWEKSSTFCVQSIDIDPQKVFKVCKKYLSHFQYSVFRGDITPSKLIRLENDLKKVINEQEDFVCIIKLKNDNVFGEDTFGVGKRETGEQLIL